MSKFCNVLNYREDNSQKARSTWKNAQLCLGKNDFNSVSLNPKQEVVHGHQPEQDGEMKLTTQ